MLGGPGTDVRWVRSGHDVRQAANRQPPDLAILDMQIGTMGGIGVHFDIRLEIDAGRLEPFPTLLLLDRRADVFMARRSGVTGWLLKPLDPIRLAAGRHGPARRRDLFRCLLPAGACRRPGPGRRPRELPA